MRRKEIGHGRGREEILEELRHFRGDEGKDLEAVHLYRPARSADKRLVLAREKIETACAVGVRGNDCRGAGVGEYLSGSVVVLVNQRRLDIAVDDEHFPAHVGRKAACEVESVRIGTARGYSGTVTAIEITSTHINTPDNKKIILPNGALSNGTINNYSTTGIRRCNWDMSIPYGTDLEKAKSTGLAIIRAHKAVVNDPAEPHVYLTEFGTGYVTLSFRCWVKVDDYWDLFFDINEQIYNEFPKNGLYAPVPKMDITVKNS